MERSRVIAQLDILDKLLNGRSTFKSKDDEISNYRNVTFKILSLLEGSDHVFRDLIMKNSNYVDSVVSALQLNMDSQVAYNTVKIVNELVGKTNSQKRAQTLVHQGVTKALLQCIYFESRENVPCEEYLLLLHEVLYRIGVKDKKVGVRARLCQCLPVVINLLRCQMNLVSHNRGSMGTASIPSTVAKNILNLLHIVRLYSQNLINASRLGRNGLIGLLLKMIGFAGRNNLTILRITLETMNLCVRTKSNGARAVNQGAMAMLLQLFADWNRIDSRDKQLPLRRSILGVVKNLINLRAGRKGFLEADGLHTFYGFCDAYKLQSNLDSIVTLVSLILRKCFPKNRLPLSHYDSTLRCPLPYSSIKDKSKYLLDLRRSTVSPGAPRSTSPIDVLPLIPFLGCEGDSEALTAQRKYFNRDKSIESLEFPVNYNTDDWKYTDVSKNGNRGRARDLFRELDRKLAKSQRKMASNVAHQNYLGRHTATDNVVHASILRDNEDDLSPDQEPFNDIEEKEEQLERSLVEQILMDGSSYQPPDDRSFEKLKESYSMFLSERDLFRNECRRKTSPEDREEPLEKNNKFYDGLRSNGDNKKYRETIQPSFVSLEMNPSVSVRKMSRCTVPKNEVPCPRPAETGDEKLQGMTCTGIGIQRSGPSITQVQGLYQRIKRSSIQNKLESINITNSINDLIDNSGKHVPVTKNVVDEGRPQMHSKEDFMETYLKISSVVTKSLGRFSMIGYPDLWEQSFSMKSPEPLTDTFLQNQTPVDNSQKPVANGGKQRGRANSLPQTKKQTSNNKAANNQRPQSDSPTLEGLAQNKILDDLRRVIDSEDIIEKVVYDLDDIVNDDYVNYNVDGSNHSNSDELELDKLSPLLWSHLKFDSQFESGNLRKVIQIRQYEYDLILSPDVNTNHHTQWFYFRVSAMESGVPYRFNIINCEKPNSQFNFGMQPLLYSVKDSLQDNGYWKRWGSEIFYYKNHFARSAATCGGNTGKSYFTCTFIIEFPNAGDVCYLAYHYPYTYTRLLTDIHLWTRKVKSSKNNEQIDAEGDSKDKGSTHQIEFQTSQEDGILFTVQELCRSILNNPVPIITISNWPQEVGDRQASAKQYVFLSSRVHPGESNASWVIKGCIDFLISDNPMACQLRELYIFKIVPMLNPDGVINGCHRCSMAGQDLNRRWLDPCELLNPTIYNTKGLLMLLTKLGQAPMVYCDFHGHSRRKNVFMFGCSPLMSWISDDTNNPAYIDQKVEDQSYYTLPNVLNKIAPQFSLDCCSFAVDKVKEATARVVVWRQFGVKRSYTMESSYCSCDQGTYKNLHINVPMLEDIGYLFAESLLHIGETIHVPILRNVNFPSSHTVDRSPCSQTAHVMPHKNSTFRTDNESNIVSGNRKCMENDAEDDDDAISDNDDEGVEEESDKDEEYNHEYYVEDSD